MKRINNIILGGGIAGLILNNYIKDSILIEKSEHVARDFSNNVFPKYIHASDAAIKLFTDVGIKPTLKRFKIGIYYDSKIFSFYRNVKGKRMMYCDYCLKKYGQLKINKMNQYMKKKRITHHITNKQELIDTIYNKNKNRILINENVASIDVIRRTIYTNCNEYKYKKLISTIPINIFANIAKLNSDILRYITLNAFIFNVYNIMCKYDFIYVPDLHYRANRININRDEGVVIVEVTGDESKLKTSDVNNFTQMFCGKIINSKFTQYRFPITSLRKNVKHVRFVGRFAQGNYAIMMGDIVDEAKRLSKENI